MVPLVDIDHLNVRFGNKTAVADLSLRVHAGEVYGLLGPNGAGKTTTLRTLAGLIEPTAGRVLVAGLKPLQNRSAVLRRLGMVMANTPLPEAMTGREALRYYGAFYDLPDLEGRIALLEADLDMPYLDEPIAGYSTGMRQRLNIARALIHEPDVLVLDEATNGLDVSSRRGVLRFVQEQRDRGAAIVYSTHVLAEAEAVCDRVGIVERGRLVAEGTVPELLERAGAPNLELAYLRLAETASANAQEAQP